MNMLKVMSAMISTAVPFQAFTLHKWKTTRLDRACPEHFPVCGADGDCMIASCADGSCVGAWNNGQNYINGYDGSGLDCVAKTAIEDEQEATFSVGDRVQSKKYGTQGTVVGVDVDGDPKIRLDGDEVDKQKYGKDFMIVAKAETALPEWCGQGIKAGDKCCDLACGQCGGSGCSSFPGGSSKCCGSELTRACTSADDVVCYILAVSAPKENSEGLVETRQEEQAPTLVEEMVVPTPVPTLSVDMRNRFIGICSATENTEMHVFDKVQVSLNAPVSMLSTNVARGMNGLSSSVAGDKWLVKSGRVLIQAHYVENDDSADLRAVAISGSFLKGNTIVIGSLEDKITWNGEEILKDRPSEFHVRDGDFFVNAARSDHSSLVQDLSVENPGVNFDLPLGVSLIVNRLHWHVNVAIKMTPQEGGQDGLCGNFNGFPADDSWELVSERFNSNVPPEASLFATSSFD